MSSPRILRVNTADYSYNVLKTKDTRMTPVRHLPAMKYRHIISAIVIGLACSLSTSAQNPYLPMWEYIPDGEPYVFEDPDKPGEYRVYIYGSHDTLIKEYCGKEQVVWSAPVTDLSNWRYDGIIFMSSKDREGQLLHQDGSGDVLYAPDVTLHIGKDGNKTYYLYPNNQAGGRNGMVAKSNRPDGPFEVCNWSETDPSTTMGCLGFDPAVFTDDDGRVYGYWGFKESFAAELDPETMATVKPGTKIIRDMIPGCEQDDMFRFFEASSIRKIKDKYIFIYSRVTSDGESGLPPSNYTLAYAYSSHPLGPYKYGGTLIDCRAPEKNSDGKIIPTAYPAGNTHGSICEIDGRWWVFFHRQTGTDEFSRQAMVAPINVDVEEGTDGKVIITQGEYTSEGFMTDGLNPLYKTPAGIACFMTHPEGAYGKFPKIIFSGSYIRPDRLTPNSYAGPFNHKIPFNPVVNNTSGSIIGYKYFDFSKMTGKEGVDFICNLVPGNIDGSIALLIDAPTEQLGGRKIGQLEITTQQPKEMIEMRTPVSLPAEIKGKHALYMQFHSDTPGASLCDLYDFRFAGAEE